MPPCRFSRVFCFPTKIKYIFMGCWLQGIRLAIYIHFHTWIHHVFYRLPAAQYYARFRIVSYFSVFGWRLRLQPLIFLSLYTRKTVNHHLFQIACNNNKNVAERKIHHRSHKTSIVDQNSSSSATLRGTLLLGCRVQVLWPARLI